MAGLKLISYPSERLTVIHSFPLPIKNRVIKKEKIFIPKKTSISRSIVQSRPTNTIRFNEYTLYL